MRNMSKVYNDHLVGTDLKFGIVIGRFNEMITKNMLEGALGALKACQVYEANIDVAWVPGAFEIPLIAKEMAEQSYDAIITLGAVIRWATPYFDYVCSEAAEGILQACL